MVKLVDLDLTDSLQTSLCLNATSSGIVSTHFSRETLKWLPHLESLNINANVFTSSKLFNDFQENIHYMPNLKIFQAADCSSGPASKLLADNKTYAQFNSTRLQVLNLHGTYSFFVPMKNGTFQYFKYLVELYVDKCEIPWMETGAFQGLNSLKYLDLSWNNMGSTSLQFMKLLSSLEYIDLGMNNIHYTFVGNLLRSNRLKTVILSSNKLASLQKVMLGKNSACERLNLSNNAFTSGNLFTILNTSKHLHYNTYICMETTSDKLVTTCLDISS